MYLNKNPDGHLALADMQESVPSAERRGGCQESAYFICLLVVFLLS